MGLLKFLGIRKAESGIDYDAIARDPLQPGLLFARGDDMLAPDPPDDDYPDLDYMIAAEAYRLDRWLTPAELADVTRQYQIALEAYSAGY